MFIIHDPSLIGSAKQCIGLADRDVLHNASRLSTCPSMRLHEEGHYRVIASLHQTSCHTHTYIYVHRHTHTYTYVKGQGTWLIIRATVRVQNEPLTQDDQAMWRLYSSHYNGKNALVGPKELSCLQIHTISTRLGALKSEMGPHTNHFFIWVAYCFESLRRIITWVCFAAELRRRWVRGILDTVCFVERRACVWPLGRKTAHLSAPLSPSLPHSLSRHPPVLWIGN